MLAEQFAADQQNQTGEDSCRRCHHRELNDLGRLKLGENFADRRQLALCGAGPAISVICEKHRELGLFHLVIREHDGIDGFDGIVEQPPINLNARRRCLGTVRKDDPHAAIRHADFLSLGLNGKIAKVEAIKVDSIDLRLNLDAIDLDRVLPGKELSDFLGCRILLRNVEIGLVGPGQL